MWSTFWRATVLLGKDLLKGLALAIVVALCLLASSGAVSRFIYTDF
jgi:hypothetical protein